MSRDLIAEVRAIWYGRQPAPASQQVVVSSTQVANTVPTSQVPAQSLYLVSSVVLLAAKLSDPEPRRLCCSLTLTPEVANLT